MKRLFIILVLVAQPAWGQEYDSYSESNYIQQLLQADQDAEMESRALAAESKFEEIQARLDAQQRKIDEQESRLNRYH